MHQKGKLFVVDDDIILLKVMEELLKEYYEVSLAKSGPQAVRFLEKGGSPDLILLDIDMPDMDGFATLLKLRALNAGREVPVVYLTGLTDAGSEAYGLQLGAVDYIRKPVVKEVLLARIALHLDNAEKRRQLELFKEQHLGSGGLQADKMLAMKQLLTKTEFTVAALVAQGYTNDEISRLLNYSPSYIKKVVSRLFDRLDISKRSEVKRFFC
ncbi:response regulator transcription factor [Sporomusa sphaeroides]|uniref:Response regulator PleD n=2 Tax=Sporomusa TaxID=2375 RepID=A0ABM9W328_9FIRM|nr:DNA-binding response regulator [Sporomusa sphaeroides]OLS56754.1 response regulator PleD [Sporomusa sphaeroides DSM 2875]CVK18701.1 Response regulator PleD [Sporomusa sphaeroides DSM 2875]SCM81984.1 Response regulator receiver domain protein [uncultured Sporomusa sp.]